MHVSRDTRRNTGIPIAARVGFGVGFAVLLYALLFGAAGPSFAAETCRGDGPGLHAFDPDDDESGVGGTGSAPEPRPLRLLPNDDDESGVGGTGARPTRAGDDESGIGGTGLLGPIRVLDEKRDAVRRREDEGGSTRICLNGLEISVPDALALETTGDTRDAVPLALESGRMAWVEAQSDDGAWVATRVLLAEDRIGWTERARRGDASKRRGPPKRSAPTVRPTVLPGNMLEGVGRWTLRVSGVRVHVVADTLVHRDVVGRSAPTFRPGTWVRYQGFALGENNFYATRIELAPKGRIIVPEMRLDQHVARALREDPATRPAYVSIEGYVRGSEARPEIAGLPIDLPDRAGTDVRAAIQPGRRIRVGGTLAADGALLVRPAPQRMRPARPESPRTSEVRGDAAKPAREPAGPRPTDRPTIRPQRPADVPIVPSRNLPDRPRVVRPPVDRAR